MMMIAVLLTGMVLSSCAKGPIGADARLGKPESLEQTRKALASQKTARSPHCLRNRTSHSIQFELLASTDGEWHRWILPPGQVMHLGQGSRPELRFVAVPVAPKSAMPGNEARLVHYRLDTNPPLREVIPELSCLHEFRPRSNGMLDLFLNSDLVH